MNPNFKHKGRFFFYPLIGAAFVLGAGYAVMFLWNAILPTVIPAVGTVTFLQAIGLFALCRILFGGFRGRGGYGGYKYKNSAWKEKMLNMSEEEREKLKSEWRERCGRG